VYRGQSCHPRFRRQRLREKFPCVSGRSTVLTRAPAVVGHERRAQLALLVVDAALAELRCVGRRLPSSRVVNSEDGPPRSGLESRLKPPPSFHAQRAFQPISVRFTVLDCESRHGLLLPVTTLIVEVHVERGHVSLTHRAGCRPYAKTRSFIERFAIELLNPSGHSRGDHPFEAGEKARIYARHSS